MESRRIIAQIKVQSHTTARVKMKFCASEDAALMERNSTVEMKFWLSEDTKLVEASKIIGSS